MKIYYYDPGTGIYQGEDFADGPSPKGGGQRIPPFATTIAPPDCESGKVPCFDIGNNRWEIRIISGR